MDTSPDSEASALSAARPPIVVAVRTIVDMRVADLGHEEWERGGSAGLETYWSGQHASVARQAVVRLLWSTEALHVRFDCAQAEPLLVATSPILNSKTIGLWERDVCEVFVAPPALGPLQYFEFEASPMGEWLDLKMNLTGTVREADWDYASGMSVTSRIDSGATRLAMHLPWSAFSTVPAAGDRWRINFFRCVGAEPDRGYLAWQPTLTPVPNFHVPEAFGELLFA